MRIDLTIERLVLDGFDAHAIDADAVRLALGGELARLLLAAPLQPTTGSAVPTLRAVMPSASAATLGANVAETLHGAIGAHVGAGRQSAPR